MRELGHLMAYAFHSPEDLDKLLKPPVEETLNQAVKDPSAWEQDEWWSSRQPT